jgi:sulfite reductase alpha subunit-like flavoprotein
MLISATSQSAALRDLFIFVSPADPVMDSLNDSELERRILILYATETGNAYDVSHRISREAKRRHFRVTLTSVDEYPIVSNNTNGELRELT